MSDKAANGSTGEAWHDGVAAARPSGAAYGARGRRYGDAKVRVSNRPGRIERSQARSVVPFRRCSLPPAGGFMTRLTAALTAMWARSTAALCAAGTV